MNFDAMNPDELWAFWVKGNTQRPIELARELFPDKPKGYINATRNLAHYAANKATAIQCRLSGNVQAAIQYEDIAYRIYKALPEFARW
jgi:hypothetical protein